MAAHGDLQILPESKKILPSEQDLPESINNLERLECSETHRALLVNRRTRQAKPILRDDVFASEGAPLAATQGINLLVLGLDQGSIGADRKARTASRATG